MDNKEIYLQIKSILEGCHTLLDAIHLCNIFIYKNPELKNMFNSCIYGKKYSETVDLKTKQSILNDMFNSNDKLNADNIWNREQGRTKDDIYEKALLRIMNNRKYKHPNIQKTNNIKTLTKKCPHCSHAVNANENTKYIICGYHNQTHGYDWSGCGNDWCFSCNKKLCKNWIDDCLQLLYNRKHNDKCCRKHSDKYKNNYETDYCNCLDNRQYNINAFINV